MVDRDEIRHEVVAALRKMVPKGPIAEHSKLFADLKLLSDDITWVALRLEQRFGLWIPREQWGPMDTVGDIVNLIERHTAGG
jgi:acyl carrier protein